MVKMEKKDDKIKEERKEKEMCWKEEEEGEREESNANKSPQKERLVEWTVNGRQ